MATLQADLAASGVIPRCHHVGVHAQYAKYTTASGTFSVGDIIQMMKIPDGAKVVGGWLKCSALVGSTVAKINLGTRGDNDGFIASQTCKTARSISIDGSNGALLGTTHDRTDSDTTRYTMIEVQIGGTSLTGTGTVSIEACLYYYQATESH